ncbi:AEC family transporter [Pseudoprimorskyibacter insulae]|uniref:Transporter YfdV n=1 Tax=Pseudoprimorskyibacter insulae TaxID=1695997 RepID=A0A2R8AWE6_9RHOB|nr:AEC family transporter [Pseudoprimorskyibacter insulae]SPF80318.1 hypothetical protein PRI8871_02121 [Pseudoprimorskyibacter insulae]
MLHILTHDILPVFSLLALGFLLGWRRKVVVDEARAINRVGLLILQPALIFPLVAQVDFHAFEPLALALYALCQTIGFTIAFIIARYIFRRERLEAWLLAMTMIFVNTLLYIWPISLLIFGEAAALPIKSIVAWDATVTFAFFIISSDLMSGHGTPRQAMGRVVQNPILIGIVAGAIINLARIPLPEPILTATHFAGVAAAPLTLFALGVILSQQSLRPTPVVVTMTGLKLFGFPLLVWAAVSLSPLPDHWQALFVLDAAGPAGAMAFALAMLHGVRTDAIAPVIIWTSILSLLPMAWLA